MKTILCSDLGGPTSCAVEMKGNTPDEVVKNCQEHVMEEIANGDDDHQEAVENMQGMSPEEQQDTYAEYMKICEDAFKRD
jgi:predicted small metal-binding protein